MAETEVKQRRVDSAVVASAGGGPPPPKRPGDLESGHKVDASPLITPELKDEAEKIINALAMIFAGRIDASKNESSPNAPEEGRQAEEQLRQAEAERHQREEQERLRKATEEEELRKAEEERLRKEEELRKAEEERLRKEEELRKAEEERLRKEEELRKAEEERLRKEEEERLLEEEAKKKRQQAIATEPGRNNDLNNRINILSKDSFAVTYLRDLFKSLKIPSSDKEAGFDMREQAREKLASALTLVEDFKANQLPKLLQAKKKLGQLGDALRDGFGKSRPDVPEKGVNIATDFQKVGTNGPRIAAWADAVAAGPAYEKALQVFDKKATSAGVSDWKFVVSARASSQDLARNAASAGGSLDPAQDKLAQAGLVVDKSSQFVATRKRVAEKRIKLPELPPTTTAFPQKLADFGLWIDNIAGGVTDSETLTEQSFATGVTDLEKVEKHIEPFATYVSTLTTLRLEFDKVARLVTPQTQSAAAEADEEIKVALNEAIEKANGFEFDLTIKPLATAKSLLEAARKQRAEAISKRIDQLLDAQKPGKAVAAKLKGAKDAGGEDLLGELYQQFGETDFAAVMNGFKANDDDPSESKQVNAAKSAEIAAAKLGALGTSVGAGGIKQLSSAFGGTAEAGISQIGQIMKHGMADDQVAALTKAYDLGTQTGVQDLKGVYNTSFRGNPEAFAKIVGAGLKMPNDKGPEAITRLADMTKAFGNDDDVQTLVDGLLREDAAVGSVKKLLQPNAKNKLESDQCGVAASRMNGLLNSNFKGDAKKLKDPFFDTLKGCPTKEIDALKAARKAVQDYNLLGTQEKAKQKAPPPFTQDMQTRLDRLLSVGGSPPKPEEMAWMVRNAASMKTQTPAGKFTGTPPSNTSTERLEHFARHTKNFNTLTPPALASETTPIGDAEDKPTTFWPENTGADIIKTMTIQAMTKAGKPPGGWNAGNARTKGPFFPEGSKGAFKHKITTAFYQADVVVDYPLTVAGTTRNTPINVRLGAEIVTTEVTYEGGDKPPKVSQKISVTQFYPTKQDKLDTVSFEDMQTIKLALGKRKIA